MRSFLFFAAFSSAVFALVACSATSEPSPSAAAQGTDAAATSEDAGACTLQPKGYIYFLDPLEEIPDCMKDSNGPITAVESVRFYTDGDASIDEAQFGDFSCAASLEGCHLTSGCGIFLSYDRVGLAGLVSLDVTFIADDEFEGTLAIEVPERSCKEKLRVHGKHIGI